MRWRRGTPLAWSRRWPGASRSRETQANAIALVGIYEISKLLTSSLQLEHSLSKVLNLLASYLQMRPRHGDPARRGAAPRGLALAGLESGTIDQERAPMAWRAIERILGTAMPIVVGDVAPEPMFDDVTLDARIPEGSTVASWACRSRPRARCWAR